MNISPIELSLSAVPQVAGVETAKAESTTNFVDWLTKEIGNVNNNIRAAEMQVSKLAVGETENLHQVMLSLSKAKLSFDLLVQVRNKLLEGYQEIMRMQI